MWILFNFVSVCITPCVPGLANIEIMNIVKELCFPKKVLAFHECKLRVAH